MADPSQTNETQQPDDDEPGGVVDALSVFYVIGGIPAMIVFFVVLFLLVGACDQGNVYIPA